MLPVLPVTSCKEELVIICFAEWASQGVVQGSLDVKIKIPASITVRDVSSYTLWLAISSFVIALSSSVSHSIFESHAQWVVIANFFTLLNGLVLDFV